MVNAENAPSAAAAESSSTTTPAISKSQLKKLKKQQSQQSQQGSQSTTPVTPAEAEGGGAAESPAAGGGGGDDAPNKNPYIEAVAKRLRNVRKKLKKIEGYEQLPKDKLNADQRQSLDKKSETQMLAKELDEIVKALSLVETDEGKNAKRERAEMERAATERVEKAVAETKAEASASFRLLCRAFMSFNVLYPAMYSQLMLPLNNEQINAINSLKTSIFGDNIPADSNFSPEEFTETALHHLTRLLEKSGQQFTDGFSYADLSELVERIAEAFVAPRNAQAVEFQASLEQPSGEHQEQQAEFGGYNGYYQQQEEQRPVVVSGGLTFGTVKFGNVGEEGVEIGDEPAPAQSYASEPEPTITTTTSEPAQPIPQQQQQTQQQTFYATNTDWASSSPAVDEDSLTPVEDEHPSQSQISQKGQGDDGFQTQQRGGRGRGRGYRGRGRGGGGGQGGGYRGARGGAPRGAPQA